MSQAHKKNLPLIQTHVDRMGYTFSMIEASLGWTGERADLWAIARRPVEGAFPEHPYRVNQGSDQFVSLYRGSSSVHEYKASVQDLKKDQDKPWRKPGARALGERRFYWLEHNGPVRPEHVDERLGWGVVIFTATDFEIVRPSDVHPCGFRDTVELALQVLEAKHREGMTRAAFGGMPGTHNAVGRKPEGSAPEKLPTWIYAIRSELKKGPAKTSALCRFVESEYGKKLTPSKMVGALNASRIFDQAGAGGVWTVKAKKGNQQ